MDGTDYKLGDVIVFETEDTPENPKEFWVLHATHRHPDGYWELEKLAACDVRQVAELIGSLVKAYTDNGNAIPTLETLV